MHPIDTIETEYKGYTIRVNTYADEHMGPPWEEHDGHGIVSDWEHRDKHPGELVLCEDRRSKRFYDFQATMKKAKSEGWGLGQESLARLASKLGRKPTKGEILHASVMEDYEHLRGWCNNEWHWQGYRTEIVSPDGETVNGDLDSCWGYDDAEYKVEEAQANAQFTIDRHIEAQAKEAQESHLCACADIATS